MSRGVAPSFDLARIVFEVSLNPNLHRPVSYLGTNGVLPARKTFATVIPLDTRTFSGRQRRGRFPLAAAAGLPSLIQNRNAILKSFA